MAVVRRVLGVFAGVILSSMPLTAQSVGAIRGRVLDSASSIALAKVRTAILSGRQSSRSEMPAKNRTAAKNTVERM